MSAREFLETMRRHGMTPPAHIEPGRLYRFPGANKRDGNTASWAKLFPDGRGGVYGDWSTGLHGFWQERSGQQLTGADRAAFKRQLAIARREEAAEREATHGQAAARALSIWRSANPAPADHQYLALKRIQPHCARIKCNRLILPVVDISTDRLMSIQYIDEDGGKMLLKGGRKRGCAIPTDWIEAPSRIIIAEGFATAATLAESYPDSLMLAAIDAGNLEPVALAVRRRWPAIEIVVAGDDDRSAKTNIGRIRANAAALAAGALVAFPEWPPDAPPHLSDFNDLAVWMAGGVA